MTAAIFGSRWRILLLACIGALGAPSWADEAQDEFESASLILAAGDSTHQDKQQALATLATLRSAEADELLAEWMGRVIRRSIPAALALDVLEAVQMRATPTLKQLFANYEKSLPSDDSLARFRVCQEGGDPERGREIFFRHRQVQCAKCHRIEGQGGDAGPDFTRLASNVEPRYIVQSLVQPNFFLAEGYGEMTARLGDGSLVTGRLKQNRPEGLELILVDGSKVILPHDDIEARTDLHSSMPAMDKLLTLREMRDVVAFLMTRK